MPVGHFWDDMLTDLLCPNCMIASPISLYRKIKVNTIAPKRFDFELLECPVCRLWVATRENMTPSGKPEIWFRTTFYGKT
jgi:hypothetical protein